MTQGWGDNPSSRIVKVCCWPYQKTTNCFWQYFLTSMEEKSTCQVNSCIRGSRTCVNLLKQLNHTWHGSCNWSQHLVKLTIIYCHSPRCTCFLRKQRSELNWDVTGIITPAPFKSLMIALISVNPPGICRFWFTIFLGRVALVVSIWPFPP